MRIVHFADVHLGHEAGGQLDPATGLNTRVGDVLDRLDEVVAFVAAEGVDAVCFAGDAFRSSRPDPTLEDLFAARIRAMADSGAAVVLVPGDHDQPHLPGHRGPLDIYATLRITGVHVARRPGLLEVPTPAGPLIAACLPWPGPGCNVAASVEAMAAKVGPGSVSILVAHVAVAEAGRSPAQPAFDPETTVRLADVAHPAFPYVALGHVHRHQGDLTGGRGTFTAYSGALERRDFSEEREEKGFYVIDVHGGRLAATPEFVGVAARPFRTIEVTLPDDADAEAAVEVRRQVATQAPGAIVRIRVEGPRDALAHVRPADLKAAVEGAAHVRVELRARRGPRHRRAAAVTMAANERQALDAWLEAHPEMPDRDRVRHHGRQLIAEVVEG